MLIIIITASGAANGSKLKTQFSADAQPNLLPMITFNSEQHSKKQQQIPVFSSTKKIPNFVVLGKETENKPKENSKNQVNVVVDQSQQSQQKPLQKQSASVFGGLFSFLDSFDPFKDLYKSSLDSESSSEEVTLNNKDVFLSTPHGKPVRYGISLQNAKQYNELFTEQFSQADYTGISPKYYIIFKRNLEDAVIKRMYGSDDLVIPADIGIMKDDQNSDKTEIIINVANQEIFKLDDEDLTKQICVEIDEGAQISPQTRDKILQLKDVKSVFSFSKNEARLVVIPIYDNKQDPIIINSIDLQSAQGVNWYIERNKAIFKQQDMTKAQKATLAELLENALTMLVICNESGVMYFTEQLKNYKEICKEKGCAAAEKFWTEAVESDQYTKEKNDQLIGLMAINNMLERQGYCSAADMLTEIISLNEHLTQENEALEVARKYLKEGRVIGVPLHELTHFVRLLVYNEQIKMITIIRCFQKLRDEKEHKPFAAIIDTVIGKLLISDVFQFSDRKHDELEKLHKEYAEGICGAMYREHKYDLSWKFSGLGWKREWLQKKGLSRQWCDLYIMSKIPNDEYVVNLLKSNPNAIYIIVGNVIYNLEEGAFFPLKQIGEGAWLKDIIKNKKPNDSVPLHLSEKERAAITLNTGFHTPMTDEHLKMAHLEWQEWFNPEEIGEAAFKWKVHDTILAYQKPIPIEFLL